MYDREMVSRAILSSFISFLEENLVEKELVDGFKEGVRSIIVAPGQVPLLKRVQREHGNGYTRVGMVDGYPYGGFSTATKVNLVKYALAHELDEIDLGINITAVCSGDFDAVKRDVAAVLEAAGGKLDVIPLVWVIRLPLEVVDKLCQVYVDLGIKRVKTSPGIHFGDMKVEHVEYLARHFGDKLGIEVAGRCRSREKAEAMTLAGAESFHISQWRRIGGIGYDIQFDYDAKRADYAAYQDRL